MMCFFQFFGFTSLSSHVSLAPVVSPGLFVAHVPSLGHSLVPDAVLARLPSQSFFPQAPLS